MSSWICCGSSEVTGNTLGILLLVRIVLDWICNLVCCQWNHLSQVMKISNLRHIIHYPGYGYLNAKRNWFLVAFWTQDDIDSSSCVITWHTPTPWNVSYFPQWCTARETQEHRPNGLWHNREIRAFLQQSDSIRFHSTVPNIKWNDCCTSDVCQTFCTEHRTVKVHTKCPLLFMMRRNPSYFVFFSETGLYFCLLWRVKWSLALFLLYHFTPADLTSLNLTLRPQLRRHRWLITNQWEQLMCFFAAPEPAGVNHILFQHHFPLYTQAHLSFLVFYIRLRTPVMCCALSEIFSFFHIDHVRMVEVLYLGRS